MLMTSRAIKPASLLALGGTAEQAAEKVAAGANSLPQALKRGHIFNDLTARLKSCPSHTPRESEFFRSL
jgi:hypothetical protein